MGSIGKRSDNSVTGASFSKLQHELLDQHNWHTCDDLAAGSPRSDPPASGQPLMKVLVSHVLLS